MKAPKIKFKKSAFSEITDLDNNMKTKIIVEREVTKFLKAAGKMLEFGLIPIEEILNHKSDNAIIEAWQNNSIVVAFFGDQNLDVKAIKIVRKRMKRAHRRLTTKRIKIRLLSQKKASKSTVVGHNYGSILSPKTFVLFPRWFKQNDISKAGTVVHEMFHDIAFDQEVEIYGKKVTVYGKTAALALAKQSPEKARKSPENYEQFCKEIWKTKIRQSKKRIQV